MTAVSPAERPLPDPAADETLLDAFRGGLFRLPDGETAWATMAEALQCPFLFPSTGDLRRMLRMREAMRALERELREVWPVWSKRGRPLPGTASVRAVRAGESWAWHKEGVDPALSAHFRAAGAPALAALRRHVPQIAAAGWPEETEDGIRIGITSVHWLHREDGLRAQFRLETGPRADDRWLQEVTHPLGLDGASSLRDVALWLANFPLFDRLARALAGFEGEIGDAESTVDTRRRFERLGRPLSLFGTVVATLERTFADGE